jgi:hypothetical protein
MPVNRARSLLAHSQPGQTVSEYPLSKKLRERGVSVSQIAAASGVPMSAVSHFLRGRLTKAGRDNRRRIREAMVDLGILKPRHTIPTACRHCGLLYPTRKNGPMEFRPVDSVQAKAQGKKE